MGEPSEFGRRLKAFRLRAGLSQNQLSRLSGVPRPTISVVESGAQLNMNVENTFKLARALSVPVELLVHGDILEEDEPDFPPSKGKTFLPGRLFTHGERTACVAARIEAESDTPTRVA